MNCKIEKIEDLEIKINNEGHLVIGEINSIDLAKKYGTPLYVLDEEKIINNCQMFKKALDNKYNDKCLVAYASKALNCLELCRIMKREGLGVDVVSGGELYTALKAEINPNNIIFHGNNKSYTELEMAIENKIGRIVVDNQNEIDIIDIIAKEKGIKANVMVRLSPGIDVHTHAYIRTGQIDSKFGFPIETGAAFEIVEYILSKENINLTGFHCHIGSQIFEIQPFKDAATVMLTFINKVKTELGYEVKDLNLGGGFGITYTEEDDPPKYEDFIEAVHQTVEIECKKMNLNIPFIIIEPGRSIIGEAGTTLYTVGAIKNIPGYRTYVSIDGGMADNPRYALYKSKYLARVANKMNEELNETITLAGKCCESGDLIGENMKIQNIKLGDTIAVFSTGAYNYSMSSNYNRLPKPPIVLVNKNTSKIIVKRETYEDICRNDI